LSSGLARKSENNLSRAAKSQHLGWLGRECVGLLIGNAAGDRASPEHLPYLLDL
jgi:hypothetical protein